MGHLGTNSVHRSSPMVQWNGIVRALVCPLNVRLHHGNMVWDGIVVIPSPNARLLAILDNHLNLDSTMSQAYDGESEIMLKYGQEIKPKYAQEIKPMYAQEIKPNYAQEIMLKYAQEIKPMNAQEIKPKYAQEIKSKNAQEIKSKKSSQRNQANQEIKPIYAQEIMLKYGQ